MLKRASVALALAALLACTWLAAGAPPPKDPACVRRCNNARNLCTSSCSDLVGAARGSCLISCSRTNTRCISACPAAPRPPAGSVEVELAWDSIRAIDDGESGSAEPYMWTAFFKIDASNCDIVGGKLKVKPGATLVTFAGDGRHGNLPEIRTGQTKAVGSTFTFRPLLRPFTPLGTKVAIVGSITVLLEEDGVSDNGALAGARAFRREVENLLKDTVNNLKLSAGAQLPDLSTGITKIQAAVVLAIRDEQDFFENLGTILGSPDDFLGSQVVIASVADGVPGGIKKTINIPSSTTTSVPVTSALLNAGGDGKWQLFGHVKRIRNN